MSTVWEDREEPGQRIFRFNDPKKGLNPSVVEPVETQHFEKKRGETGKVITLKKLQGRPDVKGPYHHPSF